MFGNPRPGTQSTPPATATRGPSTLEKLPEPKADPAADAALKRKIERQARALIGDRARALEVRVSGKQVVVEARGVRLLQKRAVRRSLESMSSLTGLRSSVVVLD